MGGFLGALVGLLLGSAISRVLNLSERQRGWWSGFLCAVGAFLGQEMMP